MIGQSNQDAQNKSRGNMVCIGVSSDNTSNSSQLNYPQVDVHTLDKNIMSKARSEVDNVITSAKTRV